MNELAVSAEQVVATYESPSRLTAEGVRAQVNLIQEVMGKVMKKKTHYGVIKGCDKPSLFKAGSEVLLTTFRIAVLPDIEDLSTPDERRYRVHAKGIHIPTGTVVGIGIGECSSMEEKYKWRKTSNKEWDETTEDRRRIKHGADYSTKQVRAEIADVSNTILKMAKKRAQVDMTLTALAASDIFTQDIEDLPEGSLDDEEAPEKRRPVERPQSKSKPQQQSGAKPESPRAEPGNGKAGDRMNEDMPAGPLRVIRGKMATAGLTDEDLVKQFGPIEKWKFGQFAAIQAWIAEQRT